MTQMIFLSVPKSSRAPVKSSLFKCSKTQLEIVANDCMIPASPYTGRVMQKATTKSIEVNASDMKEAKLKHVGNCTNCSHQLYANASALKSLSAMPHCIMCGTEIIAETEIVPQILKDIIPTFDLGEGENLHDDPNILHGDPKFKDVALNDQLLASQILSAMDNDDDASDDSGDDDQDDLTDDEDGDDDDQDGDDYDYEDGVDGDGDGDGDDADSDDDHSDDEDEDGDDQPEDDDYDYGDDDQDDGADPDGDDGDDGEDDDQENDSDEADSDDDQPEDAGTDDAGDDDDTMDATASDIDDDDEGVEDTDSEFPDTLDSKFAATTMEPDAVVISRDLNIHASEALYSLVTADTAELAVLPIDNSSAMILANVENVGYMPYIAIEASKAKDELKSLFASPSKLVNAVNAVLANSTGDLEKDLASFGVRQLTYTVRSSSLIEQRIKEGVAVATAALNDEREHIIDDLRQCLSIASVQVLKNLENDATNTVSAALSESLKKVGVRSANNLVDQAFTDHGPELMKTIISKALDLMSKPFETRNEISKYVTAAAGRSVTASTEPKSIARSLAEGNIPLSTATAEKVIASADVAPVVTDNVVPLASNSFKDIVQAANRRRHAR
jgi:hypothetical protein